MHRLQWILGQAHDAVLKIPWQGPGNNKIIIYFLWELFEMDFT